MGAQSLKNAAPGDAALGKDAASTVREIPQAEQQARRARRRVTEYLRVQGLRDETRLAQLSNALAAGCDEAHDPPAEAVARAQQRVERFLHDVFGNDHEARVDGIWLRAFVEAHPQQFLGPIDAARAAAEGFGDLHSGDPPRRTQLCEQQLRPMRVPSFLLGLLPPLLFTACVTGLLLWDLARDGLSLLELAFGFGFGFVFALPAAGLTTALLGSWPARKRARHGRADQTPLPRSVLVVPICHEDPEQVFARVAAMRESLAGTAGGNCFDVFVLSDTRDPRCTADEERAFRRIAGLSELPIPVYYRRRLRNRHQKSGNLAEFFERFGSDYRYAVVLDADSLMTGATMVELVRRMEAQPQVGLMQAALLLHNGRSLLARTQQLMASVCGPAMMRGLARWSGPHGNYYGHNAIVRVDAFMQSCGLPILPGGPPFGGPFMSHDFVEAALLCRAGFEVRIAWDLQESWEEMPQGLSECVARERRWCQGNLQHVRVLLADGLKTMSRIHLATGVMSYLAAPALLVFLAFGTAWQLGGHTIRISPAVALCLLGATCACLLLPRLLSLLGAAIDPSRRRLHGGLLRLCASMAAETLLSCALAPLLMLHHVFNLVSILTGGSIVWGGRRRDSSSLAANARLELPTTLIGLGSGAALLHASPALALWLSPLWVPWMLAVPIAVAASSPALGAAARRLGLLLTPSEVEPHALLRRAEALRALTMSDAAARFRDLVLDPVLLAAHLRALGEGQPRRSAETSAARARALRLGPAALSSAEIALLERDAESLRLLHREAWRKWPIESWQLARSGPHTPAASCTAAE